MTFSTRRGLLAASLLLAGGATAAHAQTARGERRPAAEDGATPPPGAANVQARPAPRPPLPAPSLTHHTLTLSDGRSIGFTATAGALRDIDDKGVPQYDIAFIAYTLDGADPRTRPVTFAFNGGPGNASAWLQLGMMGPWRLPFSADAAAPSAPPVAQPNPDSWLDFTDLVFVDPVGTGYSRFVDTGDATRKRIWSVDGDVDVMATTIRRWLVRNDRATSPKYALGESYGGIRGPRVVRALQTTQGIGVSGLLLVSPALDMHERDAALDPLDWVKLLPSEVAATRALHGPVDRAGMADVETYAVGDYLADLIRGDSDPAAVKRVVDRVTALTGLDPSLVRDRGGRIDTYSFSREIDRAQGAQISFYDASVAKPDPFPDALITNHPDAMSDALIGPITSAMFALYARELKWQPDAPYELQNREVGRSWDFGRFRPESASQLRAALALDPHMRLLVGHGLFDLVTPYFGTQLMLNQFPPTLGGNRVELMVMPGGHMFYSRDESRLAFTARAKTLYSE